MKSGEELTLVILGSYLEPGLSLSLRDLSIKANTSQARTRCILSILEKRGYLRKVKDTDRYVLGEKMAMLM